MKKFIIVSLIFVFLGFTAIPAMAATEWNVGASLRYETFWNEVNYGKEMFQDIQGGGKYLDSDGRLAWGTRSNSRIKFNMRSDNLEGFIELGYDVDGNTVTTREYWGRYKFGEGWAITIGQQHQLFNTTGLSNQVWGGDLNMHGIGVSWRSPSPQIRLTYNNFNFALSKPYTGAPRAIDGLGVGHVYDRNADFPAVQASYQYKTDTWRVKLAGAYLYQKIDAISTLNDKSKSINSWLVSMDGDINFGPLYLAGAAAVGQNWADAEWNTKNSIDGVYTQGKALSTFGLWGNYMNGTVKNTTSFMAAAIVGYRLTEAVRLEAGAGYRHDSNSLFNDNSNIMNFYIQMSYKVAPGFTITPEAGYIDWGKGVGSKMLNEKGTDLGYTWYMGAKWQMDF